MSAGNSCAHNYLAKFVRVTMAVHAICYNIGKIRSFLLKEQEFIWGNVQHGSNIKERIE